MEPNQNANIPTPTPTVEGNQEAPTKTEQPTQPDQGKPKTNKPLIATCIILAILALGASTFGIYSFLDSNNKSEEISTLKSNISNKDTQLAELENRINGLEAENDSKKDEEEIITGPETETDGNIAKIVLGEMMSENEQRKVYKIGECTTDGPSTKCNVITSEGEGLISHNDDDEILRLSIPIK